MTYPAIVAIGFPGDQGMSAVYKACSGEGVNGVAERSAITFGAVSPSSSWTGSW